MTGTALIAIGGNSLIRAGEKGTIAEQLANARSVSGGVAALLREGWEVVITHGNGPQVGAALLRSERAAGAVYEQGLDVCVASTQGEIGYLLQQALQQEILHSGLPHAVATVLTQVVVNREDPAFAKPTKPIGPFLSRGAAEEKTRLFGWVMVEDASRGYRRVVPSPEPLEIIEEALIRRLIEQGIVPIAVGGGGIPVVRTDGELKGVDAVVDKDRASVLLAQRLPADLLVFSTGAEHVYLNYRKPNQRALIRAGVMEMRDYLQAGQFPPGSMGPKIEAAIRFLEGGGRRVIVTSDEHLVDAVHGAAGTHIVPDPREPD
jgi:carbamate kinase